MMPVTYKKGVHLMKKALIMVFGLFFLYFFSAHVSAQQRIQKSIQTDSTSMKQKTPSTRTRKQKTQVKKTENEKIELQKPQPWYIDRPLLMKEKKDTLQKNAP
jgi:hypothetical protein